jgi:hypothetical protein
MITRAAVRSPRRRLFARTRIRLVPHSRKPGRPGFVRFSCRSRPVSLRISAAALLTAGFGNMGAAGRGGDRPGAGGKRSAPSTVARARSPARVHRADGRYSRTR